ncbi:pentapeptide repeat-containing protein [Streptomyces sp. NPDC059002]|uniref:pentapeptide repeat-containing protein n=1 Tax=Streptomyces sp. NPDC059002 TaxID=3346690 RepID=UPI003675BD28
MQSNGHLQGADLSHASLRGARLDHADLTGAHLGKAALEGAGLRKTPPLSVAQIVSVCPTPSTRLPVELKTHVERMERL